MERKRSLESPDTIISLNWFHCSPDRPRSLEHVKKKQRFQSSQSSQSRSFITLCLRIGTLATHSNLDGSQRHCAESKKPVSSYREYASIYLTLSKHHHSRDREEISSYQGLGIGAAEADCFWWWNHSGSWLWRWWTCNFHARIHRTIHRKVHFTPC